MLASGCGAVSTFLAEPGTVEVRPPRGMPPESEQLRALFKALFGQGTRYKDTGGIHAAALTEPLALGAEPTLIAHAEDIGRHNAVDKAIGGALLSATAIYAGGNVGCGPTIWTSTGNPFGVSPAGATVAGR